MFSEFLVLVPETNQFHEVLNKIFRKKIKRAKVRSTQTSCIAPLFRQYTLVIIIFQGVHGPRQPKMKGTRLPLPPYCRIARNAWPNRTFDFQKDGQAKSRTPLQVPISRSQDERSM